MLTSRSLSIKYHIWGSFVRLCPLCMSVASILHDLLSRPPLATEPVMLTAVGQEGRKAGWMACTLAVQWTSYTERSFDPQAKLRDSNTPNSVYMDHVCPG